jgi:hypothetical protein
MIGAILEDVHSLKHIEASDLIDTYRNNRYEIMEKANNLILSDEDQDQPNE